MAIDKNAFLCRIGKEKADQDRAIDNAGRGEDCHGMFLEEKDKDGNGNKEDEKKKGRKGIESVMLPYQKPSVHRKEEGKDFLEVGKTRQGLIDRNPSFGMSAPECSLRPVLPGGALSR